MADADGPGAVLSLEEVQALGSVEEAPAGVISDSRSKDWRVHEAMTYFTMYSYNFCWPVRTLNERDGQGHRQRRTPAMAAGLADHVWTMREWVTMPGVQRR